MSRTHRKCSISIIVSPNDCRPRSLPIIEMCIRDTLEMFVDQALNDDGFLPDCRRTYLLVIAHHNDLTAEIEGQQRHDVALTGLVVDEG
jgi:hypothetical protein